MDDTTINRQRLDIPLGIMVAFATIVINGLIIAAPGFFSHDEWQRFDDIAEHGFFDYAQRFLQPKPGHDFGTPYRPIGFLEQGFSVQWMERLPFVPHMIDVLLHTAVVMLLYFALRKVRVSQEASVLAALLFGASPLTIMATGWVGASFDIWYTLFVVTACIATLQICITKASCLRLALLAVATGGAVVSKETGVITPITVAITATGFFLLEKKSIDWKKVTSCTLTSVIIVTFYLWFRLPALRESFSGTPSAAYAPTVGNIPHNIISYLAYPFLVNVSEIVNFQQASPMEIGLALLIHALLPLYVGRRFGLSAAFLYVLAYLTFILPVLWLPGGGSHYLYACAIPMGIAIGGLLDNEWSRRRWLGLGVLATLIASLIFHTWRNELFIYNTASCQTHFIDSLDTRLFIEKNLGTKTLIIHPNTDAPAYVGLRAVHDRKRYSGTLGPAVIIDLDRTEKEDNNRTIVRMTKRCSIR